MRCAVVLAAGRSSRMGSQKLLLPFDGAKAVESSRLRSAAGDSPPIGRTVIQIVVDEIARSAVELIVVVVGHEAERVEDALHGREVVLVRNPDPCGDMLSSVRCGLRALPEASGAILVALGDQPRIGSRVVDALFTALDSSANSRGGRGRGIVVPVHLGKRGHPILFGSAYRAEVLEHHDGVGLRGLLAAHPEDVLELEVAESWVLHDMDLPADYERERRERGA